MNECNEERHEIRRRASKSLFKKLLKEHKPAPSETQDPLQAPGARRDVL